MKIILALVMLLPLLAGCATMERLDSVRSSAEKLIEDSLESAAMDSAPIDGSLLTKADAERIALEKAGLNRGQVSRLRTEYEWEEERHKYEVEFRQGPLEYHFDIDARTGEILSWEREHD